MAITQPIPGGVQKTTLAKTNPKKALEELFTEVGTYRNCDQFSELLNFISRFPKIAPYNAMLVHMQKPGSRFVASAKEWRENYGRTIRPSARPLVILRTFGPVEFVFELSETEGAPVPDEILNPFKTEGEIDLYDFDIFLRSLPKVGVFYEEGDYGTNQAGSISWLRGTKYRENGIDSFECYFSMLVNKNLGRSEKFATIAHELGHLFCGHIGTKHKKWWQHRPDLTLQVKEFEAECTCWLVCERQGIINPSKEYLTGYLGDNKQVPEINLDAVFKAVSWIESMIHGTMANKKENFTPFGKQETAPLLTLIE